MADAGGVSGANQAPHDDIIGTRAYPDCYLCGQPGELLYERVRDRLFDAPGDWNVKRCPAPECGLLWLDPMPREEEIAKAYRTYYTHADSAIENHLLRRIYRSAKLAYVLTHYRPNGSRPSAWDYVVASPIRILRSVREEIDIPIKYLAGNRGRMIDVGCGNGVIVETAREYGWAAEGIDVDAGAIANARGKGLNVHAGTLAEQKYPDSTFDLITMSHVIEHLHDPVGLLRECHRVLKADGLLMMLTPNTASSERAKFGVHWFALDPPRHLMLFNPRTLVAAARRGGFKQVRVASTLRLNTITEICSQRIRGGVNPHGQPGSGKIIWAKLRTVTLQARLWFSPLLGDELVLEARK
jgi:2-polyprenyl-3-methyl-5-hydroxy-6-metoxy-1,4-benzoquinol methylase